MKLLIIGAAGQVARKLTDLLLWETDFELLLLARQAHKRLKQVPGRVTVIDGDATNAKVISQALAGLTASDAVFLNLSEKAILDVVIPEMKQQGVKRLIVAAGMGIYDENTPAFNAWAHSIVAQREFDRGRAGADTVEASDLDYTYMRMAWLYNDPNDLAYTTNPSKTDVPGVQVSREAVCKYVLWLLQHPTEDLQVNVAVYNPSVLGLAKPTFY
ncbi:MAG: NAD(P)H-binding protein [Streptococcaceae bacterium]|jgi:nucleoside-diphosphate-sugar epimerase|nr:NAD(P)H-binding protein [Streptococcaceae bacterium]